MPLDGILDTSETVIQMCKTPDGHFEKTDCLKMDF